MQQNTPPNRKHNGIPALGRVPNEGMAYCVLGVILLLVLLIRLRLAPVPLERDEGEYALAGQLILDGVPPFVEVANMKMPGIYAAYAVLLAIFGQSSTGVHLGFMVVNLGTCLLGFLVARRTVDTLTAALAASTYAWLSLDRGVLGAAAHATHFVVLFVLIAFWLLPGKKGPVRLAALFLAGSSFGLAFMMKQHAFGLMLFGGGYVAWLLATRSDLSRRRRYAAFVVFGVAALVPFVLTCGIMAWAGAFDRFWFWTFDYARAYVSRVPITEAYSMLAASLSTQVLENAWPVWLAALVGALTAWRKERNSILWYDVAAAGFLGVCPGFVFRAHYFVLVLPAVALFSALGVEYCGKALSKRVCRNRQEALSIAIMAALWLAVIAQQHEYLLLASPDRVSRLTYGYNPFPESVEIARYIRQNTEPSERIEVLGSEPQIYFYAQRRPVSPFGYMYPLMEAQPYAAAMQDELMADLEKRKAQYIIFVSMRISWLMTPQSERRLGEWLMPFLERNYTRVGLVDIREGHTAYFWDQDQVGRKPESDDWIGVYRLTVRPEQAPDRQRGG